MTTEERSTTYRWHSPHDWLDSHVDALASLGDLGDPDAVIPSLRGIIADLAGRLDADTIQDLYQDEMDGDGYFAEVTP